MQESRYGRTGIIDEYLIYPFNGPIGYNYNYSGTYSKFSIIDKFYTDSLVKTTKRLISGGAEWSSGLTFSLSDIWYSFSGEILSYSASYPGLTLSVGDPSYPRIDSIVITEDGTIRVKKGEPSATPVKKPLSEDEILIQYAYIPSSATTIGTKVPVYLTNTQWQSSSYLISGTYSGTVSFTSTTTPFDGVGDFCVDVTSDYRTGVRFTKAIGAISLSDYGSLTLRVRFNERVPGNRSLVAQIQGTSSQYTGTASSNVINLMSYGVDRDVVNQWQHIVVPMAKFGTVVTHAKNVSFRLIGGTPNSNHSWKLDNIYFQSGAPYDEYMGEPDPSSTGGSFSYIVEQSNEWLKSVFGRTNSVPVGPTAGDRYLIIPTGTDIFTGKEDQIAEFDGLAATWSFTTPTNGTSVRVDNEDNSIYRYEGDFNTGTWVKELLAQIRSLDATTSNAGLSYSATSTPLFNSYSKEMIYLISFGATNSIGTASLSVNNLDHVLLKKIAATSGVVNLEENDLKVGGIYSVSYDGTYFQVNLGGGGVGSFITNPGDYRILTSTGSSTNEAIANANLTFDGTTLAVTGSTITKSLVVASASSSDDLVSITQTGSGNSFVVNSNNDTFIINNNGNVGIGTQSTDNKLEIFGTVSTIGFQLKNGGYDGYFMISDSNGVGTWTSSTPMGATGATGATGSTGTAGTSGTSGENGTSGTSGEMGTSGTSGGGSAGTSGTSGGGSAGTSGTTGAPGETLTPQGVEATYSSLTQSVGTSYSIPQPGFLDTYIVQDTASLWIFDPSSSAANSEGWVDMGSIQGPAGLAGTSGTSGSTGTSGTSGANGTSGTHGTSGEQGTSGTSGVGTSGTSGENGTSGTSGANGTSGTQGTSGSQGTSGTSGANGTSGTLGTSGTSGANGTSGTQGTSGSQGTSGTFGTSGTRGTSGTAGSSGSQGNSAGVQYTYITNTGNTNPGVTNLKFLSSSLSTVSTVLISVIDANSIDESQWLSSFTSGYLTIRSNSSSSSNFAVMLVTNSVLVSSSPFNYYSLTINTVYTTGNWNFGSSDSVVINFSKTGDGTSGTAGSAGTSGTAGTSGSQGTSGTSGSNGTSGTSGSQGTSGTTGTFGTSGTRGSSGSSGTSGTQGSSGTQGTSGTFGTSGSAGTAGTSGSLGTSGTSGGGTAGTSGTEGTSGTSAIGTSGTSGENGTSGTSGSQGTSGTQGSSGTSGTQGSSGTQGTSGTFGTSGTRGSSGTSGTQGSSGTSGTQGSSGTQGTSGSQGTSGTSGSNGTSGTQGSSGTQGTSGSQGTSGTRGTSGYKAVMVLSYTNSTLTLGTGTKTLPITTPINNLGWQQGTRVRIWNSSTTYMEGQITTVITDPQSANIDVNVDYVVGSGSFDDWYVAIIGDIGVTGSSGSSGPSGTSGTQGTSGTSGSQGTSGTSGSQGTSGTSGSQGTSGTSGSQGTSGTSGGGTSGTSGSQGTSGTSGSQGTSGTSGSQGTSGTFGTSGTRGTSGTSGSQGTSGTSGSQGTSGTSGSQGTSGTSGSQGTSGTSGSQGTSGTSGSQGTSGTQGTSGLLLLTGTTNNGLITLDGSAPNAVVEGNLTFDGTTLTVKNMQGLGGPIVTFFQAGNNVLLIGKSPYTSLYDSNGTSPISVGTNNLYSVATASYTSVFYEYYIKNGNNLRAGNIVAVWNGPNIQFTEVSTMDIGDTTTGINAFTFSVVLSSPNAVLQGIASISGWEYKTIIRAI